MIRYRAEASRHIDANPQALWDTIAAMTGMEDWYSGLIASSEVKTALEQPRRSCLMQDGGVLEERILLRDPATRTFVYAIDSHPLPAQDVVGTIRVDPQDGGAQVTWDAQFTIAPEMAEQMTGMLTGLYIKGLDSLAAYHTH